MNQLPESRRAVYGRTFSSRWSPAAFDPIERPRESWLRPVDVVGAVVVAALCAALLLHGMDALWL